MTLLVAWAAVDTHGVSSVYLASDSRISWGSAATFDRGRKVFAFRRHADILGYCGDVLFPSLALSQVVELADAGLLFEPSFSGKEKFAAIVKTLNHLVREYPHLHAGLTTNTLSVVHGSRDQVGNFSCNTISWRGGEWRGETAELPERSGVLFALGSGKRAFERNYERYEAGETSGTSRAVFHCFCDVLANPEDQSIGGAPQLVGIIRKPSSVALNFGVIYGDKPTFLGAPVDKSGSAPTVEWRNENFELCDGKSLRRLPKAQRQPDPNRRL